MGDGADQDAQPGVAEAFAEVVRVRYAGRLSDDELAKIQDDIRKLGEASAELRAVSLTNADEPDFVYHPYRREG